MKVANYRETLVTYLRSETVDEAAKELGISVATLRGRLWHMKKAGVNIPRKGHDDLRSQLFVAQLNSLVSQYNKSGKDN